MFDFLNNFMKVERFSCMYITVFAHLFGLFLHLNLLFYDFYSFLLGLIPTSYYWRYNFSIPDFYLFFFHVADQVFNFEVHFSISSFRFFMSRMFSVHPFYSLLFYFSLKFHLFGMCIYCCLCCLKFINLFYFVLG